MVLAEKFKEEKAIQYYGSSVWEKIHIVLTKLGLFPSFSLSFHVFGVRVGVQGY